MDRQTILLNWYGAMLDALGPSHWWPGETPLEVAVGAILTQNTNWGNVSKAIWNLKSAGVLEADKLYALPETDLAEFIRPSGYYRLKARRLKNFLSFLHRECRLDLPALGRRDLESLRPALIEVKGIGPETADSILLYALNKPTFVVDAYTRRILVRHGMLPEDVDYEEMRSFFMDVLDPDVDLFNEFHALIVRAGKAHCLKGDPKCGGCPLER
ncbi:MAG: endonuclease III domain-containing protein, partial [Deltaproteobacteria bacterium]|nr:endonuclease III domain-containing protein [Deltaproteobacteria bacterium]